MKTFFKILFGAGLAFSLASCDAVQNPTTSNYPNSGTNNGRVYKSNDGQVYRTGEIYRDRNGNVFQDGRVIRTGDVYGQPGILNRGANNTVYNSDQNRRNLPPGQAKKMYGGEAKDYAKGQNKKYKDWNSGDSKKNKSYNQFKKRYEQQMKKGNKKGK